MLGSELELVFVVQQRGLVSLRERLELSGIG